MLCVLVNNFSVRCVLGPLIAMPPSNEDDLDSNKAAGQQPQNGMQALFGQVKPLKKSNRAKLKKSVSNAPVNEQQAEYLKRVAEQVEPAQQGGETVAQVSDDYVVWLKAEDILAYKKSGVQDGVYKKLRMGKYSIDGKLDLHQKTVAEARSEVSVFIAEAMEHAARTVIILHGKGARNPERRAVIKSHLAKWLKEKSEVLAFHSAQPHHGGSGAVYVLLRKSESAKEQARETHLKGRP
jgi:DNA-nicking Smr family endonuclease